MYLPAANAQVNNKLVYYVNPLTGTAASTTLSSQTHGAGTELLANTIPAVTLPFAMTQWVPQTRESEQKCLAPYYYKDSMFYGIRGTHWLSGSCTQDYGSFTILPLTGKLSLDKRSVPFSHQQEQSLPHYYRLTLPQQHTVTEITATERSAIMRITMQKTDSLYIFIRPNSDAGKGYIHVDLAKQEITGYNPVHRIYQGRGKPAGFNGYFVIRFNKSFVVRGCFSGNTASGSDSISNQKELGAYIGFALSKNEQVSLQTGTSFTGIDAARNNLIHEIPNWNFEQVKSAAAATWNKTLSKIIVSDKDEKKKRIFYTALYHSFQQPRLFSDHNGTYPVFAGNYLVAQLSSGSYYDDFSMWDIFRAQLPLLELIDTKRVNDFVRSLILKSAQGGWLPNFPCWNSYTTAMVGDHGTAFIASAYQKGIRDYDIQQAYNAMRKNAFDIPSTEAYKDGRGRRSLASYLQYGYYPLEDSIPDAFHVKEQVSRTLEYTYDDDCLAGMALALNKQEDYAILSKRGKNYRNVFDSARGFMNGRYANGNFYKDFDPDKKLFFITEGTSRQYSFFVPHDVPGLIALMGGPVSFEHALDELFDKGQYWHGNEPGQQIPFLYNYVKAYTKTNKQVAQILSSQYDDGPGGLSGNDDAGQVSAWYVLASMGIYPVNPASQQYAVTTPLFNNISLQMENGQQFRISKQSLHNIPTGNVLLNGTQQIDGFIDHAAIVRGGSLIFR